MIVIDDIVAALMEEYPNDCDSKAATERLVRGVFKKIGSSLEEGEQVRISGFGTFDTAVRAARTGINPRTGEHLDIPESRVPKFKPATALKNSVK